MNKKECFQAVTISWTSITSWKVGMTSMNASHELLIERRLTRAVHSMTIIFIITYNFQLQYNSSFMD